MRMQTSLLLAITKKLNVLKCSAITRKQVEKKKNRKHSHEGMVSQFFQKVTQVQFNVSLIKEVPSCFPQNRLAHPTPDSCKVDLNAAPSVTLKSAKNEPGTHPLWPTHTAICSKATLSVLTPQIPRLQ